MRGSAGLETRPILLALRYCVYIKYKEHRNWKFGSIPVGVRQQFWDILGNASDISAVDVIPMILWPKPRTLEIVDRESDIRRDPNRLNRAD
jgi:hypothetical protein